MPNGFHNKQVGVPLSGGPGKDTAQAGGGSMPFIERTAYTGDLPGKGQSKDRSGGVKKVKHYPSVEGI